MQGEVEGDTHLYRIHQINMIAKMGVGIIAQLFLMRKKSRTASMSFKDFQ